MVGLRRGGGCGGGCVGGGSGGRGLLLTTPLVGLRSLVLQWWWSSRSSRPLLCSHYYYSYYHYYPPISIHSIVGSSSTTTRTRTTTRKQQPPQQPPQQQREYISLLEQYSNEPNLWHCRFGFRHCRRPSSSQPSLQNHHYQTRRQYMFLPTSWTEFQLRIHKVQEPQIVHVKLRTEQPTTTTTDDDLSLISQTQSPHRRRRRHHHRRRPSLSGGGGVISATKHVVALNNNKNKTWVQRRKGYDWIQWWQRKGSTTPNNNRSKNKNHHLLLRYLHHQDKFWLIRHRMRVQQQGKQQQQLQAAFHHHQQQRRRRRLPLRLSPPQQQQQQGNQKKKKKKMMMINQKHPESSQTRTKTTTKIVPIQLSEYTQQDWFDSMGRPIASRDATGRFVNPWMSQSTNGIKPLNTILQWRLERLVREWNQYGFFQMFFPTFLFVVVDNTNTKNTKISSLFSSLFSSSLSSLSSSWSSSLLSSSWSLSSSSSFLSSLLLSTTPIVENTRRSHKKVLQDDTTSSTLLRLTTTTQEEEEEKKEPIRHKTVLIGNSNNNHKTRQQEQQQQRLLLTTKSQIMEENPTILKCTLIGHSTCFIQKGNLTILTDPIFSNRASPYQNIPIGIARDIQPTITISDLPLQIDICLISHDHYDHLDYNSILQLREKVNLWIVPIGIGSWLQNNAMISSNQIIELSWWDSIRLQRQQQEQKEETTESGGGGGGGWTLAERHSLINKADRQQQQQQQDSHLNQQQQYMEQRHPALDNPATQNQIWITACPTQHWSSRTLFDRCYRLWCCFIVWLDHEQIFFFMGDSGLPKNKFPLFQQIADYIQCPIDLAAIPIGAYTPHAMNSDSHVNPYEAVQIHKILHCRQSIAIHHNCFPMGEEPIQEPAQLLYEATQQAKINNFIIVPNGESISIDPPPTYYNNNNKKKKKQLK